MLYYILAFYFGGLCVMILQFINVYKNYADIKSIQNMDKIDIGIAMMIRSVFWFWYLVNDLFVRNFFKDK